MDIQRKCFEESNNVNPDWSFKFDEELQQYIALDSEMELQVDEFNEHWDTFRAGWQAAKAQAVPEVLRKFCNEHKDPAWRGRLTEYDKGYSDCCIAVLEMIELQEPTND